MLIYGFQIDKLIPGNGMPIVLSIEKFRSAHDRYPDSLEELTPNYLTKLPKLKPTIWQPGVRYKLLNSMPILTIESVSGDAFAQYEYDFTARIWNHHH